MAKHLQKHILPKVEMNESKFEEYWFGTFLVIEFI